MRRVLMAVFVFLATSGTSATGATHIGEMDLDGSNKRLIYAHDVKSLLRWSSDMTLIAFSSEASSTGFGEVFTLNTLTKELCQLTDYGHYYGQNCPMFLDASTVWYTFTDQSGFSEIGELVVDGCSVLDSRLLTDYDALGQQADQCNISENFVAYHVQSKSNGPTGEIYVAPKSDPTNATRLTFNSTSDRYPAIDPSETRIAYSHDDGLGTAANIHVMGIDGSNPVKITFLSGSNSTNSAECPVWSEDGTKIYYFLWNGSQSDIIVMNDDGSSPVNITNTPQYDEWIGDTRGGSILFGTTEPLEYKSLSFPSVAVTPCDTCAYSGVGPDPGYVEQPVVCDLDQEAVAATVSFKIPNGVDVCGISYEGLITEGWEYKGDVIRADSGFATVYLANSSGAVLPVGATTLFNIRFISPRLCREDFAIQWDTALSEDAARRSIVTNASFDDVEPYFDRDADHSTVVGYRPGDVTGEGSVSIGDVSRLIDHCFITGVELCNMDAADVNGSCGTDATIGDVAKLIDSLFVTNSPLSCGCINGGGEAAGKVRSDMVVRGAFDGTYTTITLLSPTKIRAVQVDLSGAQGDPVRICNESLDLLYGTPDKDMRVGLLDLDGSSSLPSGTVDVFRVEGECEVISAIVVDEDLNEYYASYESSALASVLPFEFALTQNYPNPFNPSTEIEFSIPTSGPVKLEVLNALGQTVVVLAERYYEAGTHHIEWDASKEASGVYFYRLTAGDNVDTKKMVLLK